MTDLEGLRVVEFSIAWAGPMVGRWLADYGADVVKIEHPTSRGLSVTAPSDEAPEPWVWGELPVPALRNGIYPDNDPGEHWWNRIGHWNKMNRGKRSLCLDVKGHGGRQVLEELVRRADVVVNNYSPRGVLSLGIEHETLRRINPKIVTVAMSGFGATGPGANQVSWGPILDAGSGLASTTGYPDSGPYKQGLAFPDAVGGLHGTFALLGALWERDLTGEAVHVDLSQLETLLALGGDLLLAASASGEDPPRRANRSACDDVQGVYRCAGHDQWLAISITDDDAWAALVAVLDRAELRAAAFVNNAGRVAAHDTIDAEIAAWAAVQDKHHAMAALQNVGVAAAVVSTNRDLVEDPHLADRGFFVTLQNADCRPLVFPGFPVHHVETPTLLRPAPGLGADNESILAQLGYDAAAREELARAGTIATRPPT